jgi:outer membrane receptor protein involved in Fe transport
MPHLHKALLILLLSFLNLVTIAQEKGNTERIYGRVLDSKTNEPQEFVSVSLHVMPKDSIVAGMLTLSNGDFSFANIPFGMYMLHVRFIGYKETVQKVLVTPNSNKDLGNIALEPDATVLKEVQITADKPTMSMSIDKKVYNVDKDLSVKGGTGLDAVKNIPSVSVDADGSVTLRNNNVQVYIDGKQSQLTLQQIPADQIDRIEVITNPSAKYDAGTSGGILNVVLKRNTKPGYNGSIIAVIGTNERYTTTAMLNVKQQRFNVSGTYSFNTENNDVKGYTIRENITYSVPVKYFEQHNLTDMKRTFQMAKLSLDYYINNRNTVSFSESVLGNVYSSIDNQTTVSSAADRSIYSNGNRVNNSTNQFNNSTSQISYKKTFPKAEKEWTTDANYSYGNPSGGYLYTTNTTIFGSAASPANLQKNNVNGNNQQFILQSDFTNPINDSTKIEFGIKSTYQQNRNVNQTSFYSYTDNSYVSDTALSNDYLTKSIVNAAYINYIRRIKKITVQGGLRFEQSYYSGALLNKSNQNFGYSYPSSPSTIAKSIFPAIYISKKLNAKNELQLNFTRKINRPNFIQLLPVILFADQYNLRKGNPNLQPEFANKAELNYNYITPKFNFLTSLYGQYTENPILFVSAPSSTDPNVLLNTYKNGKGTFSYGLENIARITMLKFINVTATFTPYYSVVTYSSNNGTLLKNDAYSFISKLVVSCKLPKDFTFQANGTYEAPKPLAQGTTTNLYFFDLSLNKSIKQRLFFNLILSDVLNSKQRGNNFYTPDYNQQLMGRREARFLKLTVTWTFGKTDMVSKKKSKTKSGGDNSEMQDF